MAHSKSLLAVALVAGIAVVAAGHGRAQVSSSSRPGAGTLTPLDYLSIQQLVTRYAYALDTGADEGRMYAGLFASDGAFVQRGGEAVSGHEALAGLARKNRKGALAVFHYITNHVIAPSPDGAIGREYLAQIQIGDNDQPSHVSGGGHYEDAYVKTAEGWRFKRRQFIPSQSGPQPADASGPFHVAASIAPKTPKTSSRPAGGSTLTAADYLEIQQLVARYPYGLDTGADHGASFGRLFTPDGTFTAGDLKVVGYDKLNAFAWQHRPGQGPSYARNFSMNVDIRPSPEGAVGRTFAVVLDLGEGGKPSAILNGGHYEDVYVRTPDGWRIKSRQFIAFANGPPPARLPMPPIGKETAPVPLVRGRSDGPVPTLSAEDYIEIQQLATRYPHALDTGADNGYAYADLFTPDANAFDRWVGREKIAEIPRWNPHGPRYVRHFSTNQLIEPTRDGAIGKQYFVVIDLGEGGKPSTIFIGGHYEDVYVRTAGGWRFKSRTEIRSKSDAAAAVTAANRERAQALSHQ